MRYLKPIVAVVAVCAGLAVSVPAMAYGHYRGARVGIVVGAGFGPWYSPYYYGPYPGYGYYGYAPPYYAPVVVQQAPTTYVEQGAVSQGEGGAWWYYCADPQGYYPYVQQCRNSWQRVSPTPPGQ